MRSLVRPLFFAPALALTLTLAACNASVDTAVSKATGLDCSVSHKRRGEAICQTAAPPNQPDKIYCYRTMGGVDRYREPNPQGGSALRPEAVAASAKWLPSNAQRRRQPAPAPAPAAAPAAAAPSQAGTSEATERQTAAAEPAPVPQLALEPGAVFKDCDFCPEMVVVPAGNFSMGLPEDEAAREKIKKARWEGPRHKVTIWQPFALGRYEVTKAEFAFFVLVSGYDATGGCLVWEGSKMESMPLKNWRDPGFRQTGRDPVVCINWHDAKAYVEWLSKVTEKEYRLPSEAEWEYAARAGTSTARFWGDGRDDVCSYANVNDQTSKSVNKFPWDPANCDDGHAETAPVGSFQPNGFGLFDVLGNVQEWTEDCWNKTYFGAPNDGSTWTSGSCTGRVYRGGSWINSPRDNRSAHRNEFPGSHRVNSIGFRVSQLQPTGPAR